MNTIRLVVMAVTLLLASACSGQKVASKNDTYLSAKEREELNKSQQQARLSKGVDRREDNFSRSSRGYDDDYCYSCRVRRYSTGVWYSPWWLGSGWSSTWGWRSWYIYRWGWWDPWWSWSPAYAGAGWYYTPVWDWSYYAGFGWWVSPSSTSSSYSLSYNYRPRTYTTPSGSTTYMPPRSTVVTPRSTPPRRSATLPSTIPSRPSYAPTSPYPDGSSRPSIQSGITGAGGIRSFSPTGGTRPR